MKVITLSKVFLKDHPRAGELTGFRDKFLSKAKIHTLRRNEKGHLKDGDVVSVREWSGKPYASKQVVILDGVKIGIERVELFACLRVGSVCVPAAFVNRYVELGEIAKNDGLCLNDFIQWMWPGWDRNSVVMDIVHFTDFRYAGCSDER